MGSVRVRVRVRVLTVQWHVWSGIWSQNWIGLVLGYRLKIILDVLLFDVHRGAYDLGNWKQSRENDQETNNLK
eukprot:1337121-Amorphochlora_amoeboformis.AAC.1